MISREKKLTDFYIMRTLVVNELKYLRPFNPVAYASIQVTFADVFLTLVVILMIALAPGRSYPYNHFHNILRLFDVLPNFPFTTSEAMRDYCL